MSLAPRRGSYVLIPLLSIVTMVGVTSLSAEAATPLKTAASVLSAAKSSMQKESSVHITVDSRTGTLKSTLVVDISATRGQETIREGAKIISIVVTPTFAYLSGSKDGLTSIMGLTAAELKKVGTRVISMKAGTTPYRNFASSLTTPVLTSMLPSSVGTTLTTRSGARKNYQLSWSVKSSSTTLATKSVLTLTKGSMTLPISETIKSTSGGGTTSFTKWGRSFRVKVPLSSNLVSYTKVLG